MTNLKSLRLPLLAAAAIPTLAGLAATPQQEYLTRGVVAVKAPTGVLVSWRSLVTDPAGLAFDVYRDGTKVNASPITKSTNFLDKEGTAGARYVVKTSGSSAAEETSEEVAAWSDIYTKLHLDRPAGGTTPDKTAYTYTPNDCSVGDVDGDGTYEIFVKWDPSNSQDNSLKAYAGNVYIDCYKLSGEKLWRIDLGKNIRAGAHYTQFMVYDFDGDGKAELACKTAPGTIDGQGKYVLMGDDDPTADYRNSSGIIISGPEYLTMFNGQTGAEITTVSYVPLRSVHAQSSSGWGDNYGNRSERYLACVAYLDGVKPSLVMCRGYYTHAYLCAWDFDGRELKQRWLHASTTKNKEAYGEGAHLLAVGDVDGDGCDEIVYGAASIDHDGKLLYRTGAGHGDALHLGDLDPDREGLEVFMVHEEKTSTYKWDCEMRDARTGEIIWGLAQSGNDIGRGLAADVLADYRGYEMWPSADYRSGSAASAMFDCKGNKILSKRPSTNFRIYWDGDLQDELFDGSYSSTDAKAYPVITKVSKTGSSTTLVSCVGYCNAQSCNTTKATPCLQADLFGDWREELILWDGDTSSDLVIFSTPIETSYRVPCLMQDHTYRMAVAWQNVAYNQPPHLGYYLPDLFDTAPSFKAESGTLNQTIWLGDAMTPVVYTYKNATTVSATGLPDGVTFDLDTDNLRFTLSGTPTATGTYKYTITATGSESSATLSGTLSIREYVAPKKIAHLPFDEVGDSTPNLISGSATAVGGTPTTVRGVSGTALYLDGSVYLTQPAYDAFVLGSNDFTVELWLRSTDDAAYILHKGTLKANTTTGDQGKWIGLEYKASNLRFSVDDDVKKSEVVVPASDYFNNEWAHVALVRDTYAKTIGIYINGELAGEGTDGTGSVTDQNDLLVIGNVNVDFYNTYVGAIDELTAWDGALSSADIRAHYQAGVEALALGIDAVKAAGESGPYRIIDPTTGIVVRSGSGNAEGATDGLAPGIYLIETSGRVTKHVVR